MKSMQEHILEALDTEVQINGMELVVNFDFQNSGTLYIMDGLKPIIAMEFEFKNDMVMVKAKGSTVIEKFRYDKDMPALRALIKHLPKR